MIISKRISRSASLQNDESLDFTGEVEALRSKPQAHPSGEADDAADFEKQLKALQLGEF